MGLLMGRSRSRYRLTVSSEYRPTDPRVSALSLDPRVPSNGGHSLFEDDLFLEFADDVDLSLPHSRSRYRPTPPEGTSRVPIPVGTEPTRTCEVSQWEKDVFPESVRTRVSLRDDTLSDPSVWSKVTCVLVGNRTKSPDDPSSRPHGLRSLGSGPLVLG